MHTHTHTCMLVCVCECLNSLLPHKGKHFLCGGNEELGWCGYRKPLEKKQQLLQQQNIKPRIPTTQKYKVKQPKDEGKNTRLRVKKNWVKVKMANRIGSAVNGWIKCGSYVFYEKRKKKKWKGKKYLKSRIILIWGTKGKIWSIGPDFQINNSWSNPKLPNKF